MYIRTAILAAVCTAALYNTSGQMVSMKHSLLTPPAATAPTAVPALVLYTGIAASSDGKALAGDRTVTFLLFKDETGGEPQWVETQHVLVDASGRYSTQPWQQFPIGNSAHRLRVRRGALA